MRCLFSFLSFIGMPTRKVFWDQSWLENSYFLLKYTFLFFEKILQLLNYYNFVCLIFCFKLELFSEMPEGDVKSFYNGKNVFITGGTGFVGIALVEKLLRTTEVNKIYLLVRPKRDKEIYARLEEYIKNPVIKIFWNNYNAICELIILFADLLFLSLLSLINVQKCYTSIYTSFSYHNKSLGT